MKIEALRSLAQGFVDGDISVTTLETLSTHEICQRLCKYKGVGEWTVGTFLLHTAHRPDVLLYGDLNVRRGISDLYNLHDDTSSQSVTHLAMRVRE